MSGDNSSVLVLSGDMCPLPVCSALIFLTLPVCFSLVLFGRHPSPALKSPSLALKYFDSFVINQMAINSSAKYENQDGNSTL